MEGVSVLGKRVSDLAFVTGCIFADLCLFGVAAYFEGELIKYRISAEPRLTFLFCVTAAVYAINLVRFGVVWTHGCVEGPLDRTGVWLRVWGFATLFLLFALAHVVLKEPDDDEDETLFIWERMVILLLGALYVWSTIHYKRIVWGSREQTLKIAEAFQEVGVEREIGHYPKTWGKIRVLEQQSVDGGDSFVEHYDKRSKIVVRKPKTDQNSKKTEEKPARVQPTPPPPPQTQTQPPVPVRQTTIPQKSQPMVQPKPDNRPPPPGTSLKQPPPATQNVYGKIRTMDEPSEFSEADSWVQRYEREVLGKGTAPKRKKPKKSPPKPEREVVRQPVVVPQKTPPPVPEPPKEKPKDNWVERYEREVVAGEGRKTQQSLAAPIEEEPSTRTNRTIPEESRDEESTDLGGSTLPEIEERRRMELAKVHGKVRVLEEAEAIDPQNSFVKAFEKAQRARERQAQGKGPESGRGRSGR